MNYTLLNRALMLIFATMVWGLGFVGTRWTLIDYGPYWSNGLRFVFAGSISLAIILFLRRKIFDKGALICSVSLLLGLQFQTIGIGLTTLAKSGFLTTFYAIFTPIFSQVFLREKYKLSYWFLVLLSLFGMALLCNLEFEQFNVGDTYILISAIFFSLHILLVDYYGKGKAPVLFNLQQCLYIGILIVPVALFMEGAVNMKLIINNYNGLFSANSLNGFIILVLLSSLLAFSIQVYAQQGISAHIVSLIFLLESVFSAFFGYLFFKEYLNTMSLIGCFIILLSVAMIPLCTKNRKKTILEESV